MQDFKAKPGFTNLYYQPPTTIKEPEQKTLLMAYFQTMEEADIFKRNTIKENSEFRKGSWFFGGVRI